MYLYIHYRPIRPATQGTTSTTRCWQRSSPRRRHKYPTFKTRSSMRSTASTAKQGATSLRSGWRKASRSWRGARHTTETHGNTRRMAAVGTPDTKRQQRSCGSTQATSLLYKGTELIQWPGWQHCGSALPVAVLLRGASSAEKISLQRTKKDTLVEMRRRLSQAAVPGTTKH